MHKNHFHWRGIKKIFSTASPYWEWRQLGLVSHTYPSVWQPPDQPISSVLFSLAVTFLLCPPPIHTPIKSTYPAVLRLCVILMFFMISFQFDLFHFLFFFISFSIFVFFCSPIASKAFSQYCAIKTKSPMVIFYEIFAACFHSAKHKKLTKAS